MTRRLSLFLTLCVAAACSATAPTTGTPTTGDPNQNAGAGARDDTLTIPLSQTRSADGGGIAIRFDERIADSRCPANAVCVWQGDAHVRISTRLASGSFQSAELHTALEPRLLTAGAYTISMVGMTPYPGTAPAQTSVAPAVILRVTRK